MDSESTYKIIELVGTSTTSWEEAAKSALQTSGQNHRRTVGQYLQFTSFCI